MSYNTTELPANLKQLSEQEQEYLTRLVQAGTPVCAMAPGNRRYSKNEFNFTTTKDMQPSLSRLKNWRSGYALFAKTGVTFDGIDVDPRNGGEETFAQLEHLVPELISHTITPSGGFHKNIVPCGVSSISHGGIDYLAQGKKQFLPGTHRQKYAGKGYEIVQLPRFNLLAEPDTRFFDALMELKRNSTAARHRSQAESYTPQVAAGGDRPRFKRDVIHLPTEFDTAAMFGKYGVIPLAADRVKHAPQGERHEVLQLQAYHLGCLTYNNPYLRDKAADALLAACYYSGYWDEHKLDTLRTIQDGITQGQQDQLTESD